MLVRKIKVLTDEHKAKIATTLRGKKKSASHCKSFRRAWAEGRKVHRISAIARKRRSRLLRKLWRDGKTYKNTLMRNQSAAGRELSRVLCNAEEFRAASIVAIKKHWQDPEFREFMSQVVRESRSRQVFPFKDSKLERKVQKWLKRRNIHFKKHKVLPWMQTLHQWDLVLPDEKIIIEVNGCYWHGCAKHYPKKNVGKFDSALSQFQAIAKRNGWCVLVLWEHGIKNRSAFHLLESIIFGYRIAA